LPDIHTECRIGPILWISGRGEVLPRLRRGFWRSCDFRGGNFSINGLLVSTFGEGPRGKITTSPEDAFWSRFSVATERQICKTAG